MKTSVIMFCALLAGVSLSAAADSGPAKTARPGVRIEDRWVFTMANLLREESLQKTIDLVKRAKQAGYNGLLLSDSKISKFQLQDKSYARNCRKLRQVCTDEGMKLIVSVCPMGYAAEFMAVDPNLAEGMPVHKAPFTVRSGRLEPLNDTAQLVNGSLTEWKRGSPAGWTADKPGLVSFRDERVTCESRPTLRQDHSAAKSGPVRFYQPIQVQPWHYYHVSVMAKTEGCTSKDFRIFAVGAGADKAGSYNLNWQPPAIKPTMDWTRLDATFDSLDNTQVTLYLGSYAPKGGTIWWSDVRLESGGLVNVIRRPSLPLSLTSEDGQTAFVEGRDFPEVKDAKLGHDPNPGYFTDWHRPPEVTIPVASRLREGQRVLASYHFATTVGKPGQIACCLSEPKVYELIEAQIRWVKEVVRPDIYFMGHDEMRHGGWDDSCARRHLTCGQILAGYYDADPRRIVAWLKQAAEVQGVRGVIYTTWVGDYSKLEAFLENVRQFERP